MFPWTDIDLLYWSLWDFSLVLLVNLSTKIMLGIHPIFWLPAPDHRSTCLCSDETLHDHKNINLLIHDYKRLSRYFPSYQYSCTSLTFQVVEILIILTMSLVDNSPQKVAIFSVYRQGNMLPSGASQRKPPFYFGLSTGFLHSTHSHYPAPGIHHAVHLRKCNTTSVFYGRLMSFAV